MCAGVLPRIRAPISAPILAAIFVLLAQDWHKGVTGMRVEYRLLRQSEAALVFADVATKEMPPAPRPSVHGSSARARLREQGKLKSLRAVPSLVMVELRAAGLSDPSAEGSPGRGLYGTLQRMDVAAALGVVRDADLVLLVRSQGAGDEIVFAMSAPIYGVDASAQWTAVFQEVAAFREGEIVTAYAFDVRSRSLRLLAGRYRFEGGRFRAAQSAGR
jgi:hypothetical protein